MTYECPCGCHIEIADLRRQLAEREAELARYTEVNLKRFADLESALAEAQQARDRAEQERDQCAALLADDLRLQQLEAQLDAANALLREAQCWIPDGSRRTPEQRGAKYETAGELAAAITAHLEPGARVEDAEGQG